LGWGGEWGSVSVEATVGSDPPRVSGWGWGGADLARND